MSTFTEMATGTINGHTVDFPTVHREFNDSPIALRVTASIPVSYEDITAALWVLLDGGLLLEDLDDAAYVHSIVLQMLFAEQARVAAARVSLADVEPGTWDHTVLTRVTQRVAQLYGTPDVQGSDVREVA